MKGHLMVDGGPEVGAKGPEIQTRDPGNGQQGLEVKTLGVFGRKSELACLTRGPALTNKPVLGCTAMSHSTATRRLSADGRPVVL